MTAGKEKCRDSRLHPEMEDRSVYVWNYTFVQILRPGTARPLYNSDGPSKTCWIAVGDGVPQATYCEDSMEIYASW